MKKNKIEHYSDKEALEFHNNNKSGKIEIVSSKPMTTKRDLALAYSPGVAAPVKAIYKNPDLAYDYTTKGNLVAVISNGSAILGLGNLGAIASKPVMEGKAVLFKRFADIDSIDLEIDSNDADEIIKSIKNFSKSFGGINLEDIAAPDCFIIEKKLKEILDIPVFHDDQHGTAIITCAALINAIDIAKKDIKKIKVVVNGAGASAMACTNLFIKTGVTRKNITMLDRKGVIHKKRDGLNQWKAAFAIDTKDRTLKDAIKNADVFLGLSSAGVLKKDMVKLMSKNPIIFACANPDPEITPEEIEEVRKDAIIATGRSDYPNQVNNLIGFPYIFRGALDVRAKTINEEMKVAAVLAAPFDVIVDELNAALFNSTEPVPFGVIIIFKLDASPVAESVGPVVDAPLAIVSSLTALPVVVNFMNSFPFASFKEVPIIGVLIVGEVSVLLVRVCEAAIVAMVSAPLGTVIVPPFDIDAITGVVSVLLVNVCVAVVVMIVPEESGKVIVVSAATSLAINLVSCESALVPSNMIVPTPPESFNITCVVKVLLSPPSCVYIS